MREGTALVFVAIAALAATPAAPRWPEPKAPVITGADGFVLVPGAAVPVSRSHVYRAVYDCTSGADKPSQLLPGINMAGSELNALAVSGVTVSNARFVLVFHGDALDGLLDDRHHRAKFGVANPKLEALRQMKHAGVKLYACGQNIAFAHIDPATLSPDVEVASDALIVLMTYQNQGYALLSF